MLRSRLYLKKTHPPPRSILDHLAACFPHVSIEVWRTRFERGAITTKDGALIAADAAFRHGLTVYYEREVVGEPRSPEAETLIYRDADLLVADKPHGMPVTPAGGYVERALVVRLQKSLGLPDLTPAHRLDRDTAGLVLFCVNPEIRARYHGLFAKQEVEREYLAVAQYSGNQSQRHWLVENRIASGDPWFLQRIVEGPANAVTEIELIESYRGLGLFLLTPYTGKQHQLRLHMASIGAPIVGDPLYPRIREEVPDAPALQLLARRLSFDDPVSGLHHTFESRRSLSWPGPSPLGRGWPKAG